MFQRNLQPDELVLKTIFSKLKKNDKNNTKGKKTEQVTGAWRAQPWFLM